MFRCLPLLLSALAAAAQPPDWVKRSNEHTRILLDLSARFGPEGAAALGLTGYDDKVRDLSESARLASLAGLRDAILELERRRKSESHPLVKQDLDILLDAARRNLRSTELRDRLALTFLDLPRTVFYGLRSLLDDQVAPERRQAALVRLKRYAGMEDGYRPIAKVAEERIRAALAKPGLHPPFRGEIEQSLAQSSSYLDGIAKLFVKYKLDGYQDSLATLKRQLSEYDAFLRKDLLPRAGDSYRLPPQLYAAALENYGIDIPPHELAAKARAAFTALQRDMDAVAAGLAKQKGWSSPSYRDALRQLKKDQIVGDAILPHYRERLSQIETIVREHNLVTLPSRDARIRISTPAETAANPAPNMRPPRLIGNTGEMGEFVLPLNIPSSSGNTLQYDDFTFAAASWSIAAHELRPGHEMQFAKMIERGVSSARAIFAFNSTNVEGWGLYSEFLILPHMPLEGQLASLDFRLLRAARAFLDPELQSGKITVDHARRVLLDDVITSEAMARQETDRYTFRSPGQATAYFYGYLKLLELRREVESKLGSRFHPRRFHDFVLDQGLLPPAILRQTVLDNLDRIGG